MKNPCVDSTRNWINEPDLSALIVSIEYDIALGAQNVVSIPSPFEAEMPICGVVSFNLNMP